MRSLILTGLAMFALIAQSAFAQNLGSLSRDQQPEHLAPASDFVAHMNDVTALSGDESTVTNDDSATINDYRGGGRGGGRGGRGGGGRGRGGFGRGGFGRGWGYGYGSYYWPYYSSYGYGCYYYYGYYTCPSSYYYYNSTVDRTGSSGAQERDSIIADSTNTPVACFATDSAGNWYVDADTLNNVAATQERVNHECTAGSASCNQNLGCAIGGSGN